MVKIGEVQNRRPSGEYSDLTVGEMVPFIRAQCGSAGSTRQSASPAHRDLMSAQLGFLSEAEVEERFDESSARIFVRS